MQAGEGRVWGVGRETPGYITEWNITVLETGEFLFSPVYATSLLLGRYGSGSQRVGFVNDASTENAKFVVEETELDYTVVEDVVSKEHDSDKVVYDIYGRRVGRIVTPGLYIIDGRKTYIRP